MANEYGNSVPDPGDVALAQWQLLERWRELEQARRALVAAKAFVAACRRVERQGDVVTR